MKIHQNWKQTKKIFVKTPGIKNKLKPKFQEKRVKINNQTNVIDENNKKIHKEKIKRKN